MIVSALPDILMSISRRYHFRCAGSNYAGNLDLDVNYHWVPLARRFANQDLVAVDAGRILTFCGGLRSKPVPRQLWQGLIISPRPPQVGQVVT